MSDITLSRDEARNMLATLDAVMEVLEGSDLLGLILEVEEAAAILVAKLYPD